MNTNDKLVLDQQVNRAEPKDPAQRMLPEALGGRKVGHPNGRRCGPGLGGLVHTFSRFLRSNPP